MVYSNCFSSMCCWFLLFLMCYTQQIYINVCINFHFLHSHMLLYQYYIRTVNVTMDFFLHIWAIFGYLSCFGYLAKHNPPALIVLSFHVHDISLQSRRGRVTVPTGPTGTFVLRKWKTVLANLDVRTWDICAKFVGFKHKSSSHLGLSVCHICTVTSEFSHHIVIWSWHAPEPNVMHSV